MTRQILNLGAGNRIVGEAVNHDKMAHRPEIDVVWDLNRLPWPWDDCSFTDVVAWAVLEHLELSLQQSMDEIWRILTPRGRLTVKLPYWAHEESYNDPQHRYVVGVGVFDVFDPKTKRGRDFGFYTNRRWRIIDIGLNDKQTCVVSELVVIK